MNLLDDLLRRRDEQRALRAGGRSVVRAKELPWEQNRFGKMRWYLHPGIEDTVVRNYIFYMMEIAPGGRSGRVKQQGDEVILVLEGRGWTTIDGVRHEWKAGDVVGLPLRQRGLVIQHFNADKHRAARFVSGRPNLIDPLGVDQGCGFEVLEDAPPSPEEP